MGIIELNRAYTQGLELLLSGSVLLSISFYGNYGKLVFYHWILHASFLQYNEVLQRLVQVIYRGQWNQLKRECCVKNWIIEAM